ncbi:FAD-dependent oxidoreductase [Streptomyces gobiensis]|uniref:FAD-dependent oxidoreductase n=1 Tax=Streptomyces gobiensis TaxID=2875706 RepID=UPI001E53F5F3|nr:FAD-dependent oxidoreductase [Streptomyces gobiensis]UGY94831.1 FAD-dependent oxidoreductase [Streptomyces gobiensis]
MTYDLLVIGAGPAGLSAAVAAARAGLRVAVTDAGARPGGQFFRHPPDARLPRGLARLTSAVGGLPVHLLPGHRVWAVEPGAAHCLSGDREERPVTVAARALVLATGACDRVLPFPGWELPGVLTAGGAQALLKGSGVVAGDRVLVAGTGPFLLPVASGLATAGARVVGVYEANSPLPALVRGAGAVPPGRLLEAARYAAVLARHRVPYRTGRTVIAAHGEGSLKGVTTARLDSGWRPVRGSERHIACDTLAFGYGFTPQLELPLQLGCATTRDTGGGQVLAVDDRQRTSVPGVYTAGELTGVGGAGLAAVEGTIAGLAAARAPVPATLRRRRARLRGFAAVLHTAFPVRDGWRSWLHADTVICRCEKVPYARLRAAQELGACDARSVKLLTRIGMGPCQARVCGFATGLLTGGAAGLGARPIAHPIRLSDLATYEGENP